MEKIFRYARWFGVAGSGNVPWKTYGFFVLLLLSVIEGVAIWRVIKALAGWALDTVGHRSVTARLAGATFYACSITTLILSWKLAASWEKIASYWALIDRSMVINVPPDKSLKSRMITVTSVMAICVIVEHAMSMMSQVGFDCPPTLLLKRYTLMSHGFLLLRTDYSIWFAIPILVMSKIATILWNYQDIQIVLISMGLTSRYYRLNQYVAKVSGPRKEVAWNTHGDSSKEFTWRKIREAYVKQAQLVRRLDRALGGLILLSNLVNFYFICLQLFLGITQGLSGDFMKRLYYLVSLAWLCVRVSCVVLAAADINEHSTKALKHLHACERHLYNIEIQRLKNQLSKDYIALTGKGFFSLNRTILLQMVRTYKRKTHQGEWSTENMTEAANKVLRKELTLRRAVEIYNVPFTSLQRRVTMSRGVIKQRGGQTVFKEDAEKLFAERLLQLSARGFGLTPKSVRKYAYEFAEHKKIPHSFSRVSKMAGEDWFHRFLKRNPQLTIRKPEGLSRARMNGMTKEKVNAYFATLEKVINDNNLRGKPECIYNVDETGVPLNNRPPNVVSQKGSREVVSVTSVERGQNVTVLACMNAAGQYVPPFVLFKGVRKRDDFLLGMPTGTQVAMTEKGWITEEAFMQWLQHFNRYRTQGKIILILDGHACHTSLSVVHLCESLDIELVLMPAHTSHALQPLDVSFFKPLKAYYNQHATAWQHAHPDKGITKIAFGGIFKQAWNQAATVGNATKGFQKTGIYPFDPMAVPEYKFVMDANSEVESQTSHAIPSTSTQLPNVSVSQIELPSLTGTVTNQTTPLDIPVECNISEVQSVASAEPDVPLTTPSVLLDESAANPASQSVTVAPILETEKQTNANNQKGSMLPPKPKKVKAKSAIETDAIILSTTSPESQNKNIIKQILPSPVKSTAETRLKCPRNVNKPILHLTSPQNKANLLSKEAKKHEKLEKKNVQGKKKGDSNVKNASKTGLRSKMTQDKENMQLKKKNKATPKSKVKGSSSSREWHCIYCSEVFVHPPVEDWIQCHVCEEWCHENCADRGGAKGLYKCDLCNSNDN